LIIEKTNFEERLAEARAPQPVPPIDMMAASKIGRSLMNKQTSIINGNGAGTARTTNCGTAQLDPGILQAIGVTAMSEAAFQAVLQAAMDAGTLVALDQVTLRSCQGIVLAPASEFDFFRQALRHAGLELVVRPVPLSAKPRAARSAKLTAKAAG
jgi:hypothetical protein